MHRRAHVEYKDLAVSSDRVQVLGLTPDVIKTQDLTRYILNFSININFQPSVSKSRFQFSNGIVLKKDKQFVDYFSNWKHFF